MDFNPAVNSYFIDGCGRCSKFATPACSVRKWDEILDHLRMMLQGTALKEELKWSHPCYTYNGKNVLLIGAFKDYASLNFVKGSLVPDPRNLLTLPSENSQSSKQLRFVDLAFLIDNEQAIFELINQAIEVEKAGKKIIYKSVDEYEMTEELTRVFLEDPQFEQAFKALTPGRQKGYLLFFAQAKQSKTRLDRIEKYYEHILSGKGMMDR
jgi:uncharacterized protein YdeI (YjbR/CyaY-like superfamily)